jgi:hypothetical protein
MEAHGADTGIVVYETPQAVIVRKASDGLSKQSKVRNACTALRAHTVSCAIGTDGLLLREALANSARTPVFVLI